MKNCSECKKDILCENCDKTVNQKNEFSANFNELKRKQSDEFGDMLPKYITTWMW